MALCGVGEELVRVRLRYVHRDVDRHGNERFYFRRAKGHPKHRISHEPDSPEFMARYHALLGAKPAETMGPKPNTFRWLATEYLKGGAKSLSASTQRYRRNIIEKMLQEPVRPDSPDLYEAMPLAAITPKALKVLRDRKAALPEARNQRIKALRHLFAWAHEAEHMPTNPASELKKIAHKSRGHHTWTVEEVERFEERHPIGTKARLALALLLWGPGPRRSDVYRLGRQHVRDGRLKFRSVKGDVLVDVPLLPCLQRVIDASPIGDLAFLTTPKRGEPFKSAAAFGNWFAKECKLAGVPGRAHGLRKAGATTAAENGATDKQLQAIFGWKTASEANRYTREADRGKMASDAMGLLVRSGTKDPHRSER
jgi:site-specific recombinase XerD